LTLVYARFGTAGYPGAGRAAENGFAADELKNWFTSSSRVLCRRDRLMDGRKPGGGAMNVKHAMKYFASGAIWQW